MFDDFFIRALVAGIGVAIVAGPLGCFIIWRRLAYFGDTLAHAALLGVALGLLFEINITLAVFATSATIAMLMLFLQKRGGLSSDALLGLLSHSALATGLVCLAFLPRVRADLLGLLFGDILAVSRLDIAIIYGGGIIILGALIWFWREIFATTVSPELAGAEDMQPERANIIFMMLMALVISISIKIVGVLLITALLIIPAASARHLARSPEHMAVLASVFGAVSVFGGLSGSLTFDTPSGPSIVVAAVILFIASLLIVRRWSKNHG